MKFACILVGVSYMAFFEQITAQDRDTEPLVVACCINRGRYSSTTLFGHITDVAVTDLVSKPAKV